MESENTPSQLRNINKTHIVEQTPSLPEEIVEKILSRLPVKSLLRFRCVSKSWRSLFGSKSFIKTHLENSTKNTTCAHHRIILNSISKLEQCSLRSLLNEPSTDLFTLDYSIIVERESIYLVGSCNGLVCVLLDRKKFILWNPSTRMSKKLPNIDDNVKQGDIVYYGFGCDESSGDYKVFGVVYGRNRAIGKLYSLKSNSWKITKIGYVPPFDGGCKFVSGKLHWVRTYGLDSVIESFDLKSEVYGMVDQPCYPKGLFRLSLGVLGGCLCVLCDYPEAHLDVWIMKQYGVKESWVKMATIPHFHDLTRGQFLNFFCNGPNGEILLICGSTFMFCYPEDNGFRHPLIMEHDSSGEMDIYVESLVSLVPDGEH